VAKIVKSVANLPVFLATKFPVGLHSQVEDVIQTIKNKSTEVCTIGICGEGGSGKTTLTKAIYHLVHGTFMDKSFIEDIKQISETRGYVHLQEQLLSDLLKTKVEILNVEMGRSMIRERVSGKKVLIVLDDVPNVCELLNLSECREWFGEGTVIIVTTRDANRLRIHKIDSIFRVKEMNEKECLELLSWHAFREARPKEEYHYLARSVISYCRGLPLALEVVGSCLFERTAEEWDIVLSKIRKMSYHIWEISFYCLGNQMKRDLFLDVCCCFVGEDIAYATRILNGCGVDADSGIRVLIDRNLIKLKNNKLGMHPLLQEMGRQIIHEIRQEEMWKERRLRFDGAEYVLTDNTVRTFFSRKRFRSHVQCI